MTDNNKQEQQVEEALTITPPSKPGTSEASSTAAQGIKGAASTVSPIASAALALSIIALAGSGWLYYQSTQSSVANDLQQLAAQQANLGRELASQNFNQSQVSQLETQVNNAEQALEDQHAQLLSQQELQAQQNSKLQALESQLNRLNNTTKEDWKLAEAEYLIRLANQRLLLESDSSGAEALLSSADNILNELEDPIFFATRKALAKDIQALKSTSQFDVEGYYLQLSALYDSVATLPQREPSKQWQAAAEKSTTADTATTTTDKVTSTLANLWQSIRSLVVINYNHKPIKALLPAAEYQELVTGLQLQLDVAEVALVKGETAIYQKALSRVATAVTEHFDTQAKSVTAFLGSLTALQQVNPNPELPLPRDSLVAMKELMKAWNNRTEHPQQTKTLSPVTTPIDAPKADSATPNAANGPSADTTSSNTVNEESPAPGPKEAPQSPTSEAPADTTGDEA